MNNAKGPTGVRQGLDTFGGNGILLDYHVGRHHAGIEAVYTYEGTDSVR